MPAAQGLPPTAASAVAEEPQDRAAALNRDLWRRGDLVAEYDHAQLRPVEVLLLVRHREALSGRVLEIGPGAGRVTRYLAELSRDLHAVDVMPEMVERTREVVPSATVSQGDVRRMPQYAPASFDAVVATCNVLDALDPHGRQQALAEIGRVLVPGGLVLFSSHNRAAAGDIRRPAQLSLHDGPRQLLRDVAALPRRVRNRRERLPLEREAPGYAILNDVAHDYAVLHYYVFRDDQARQLAELGFRLEAVYDLAGRALPPGEQAPEAHELHYVARSVHHGAV